VLLRDGVDVDHGGGDYSMLRLWLRRLARLRVRRLLLGAAASLPHHPGPDPARALAGRRPGTEPPGRVEPGIAGTGRMAATPCPGCAPTLTRPAGSPYPPARLPARPAGRARWPRGTSRRPAPPGRPPRARPSRTRTRTRPPPSVARSRDFMSVRVAADLVAGPSGVWQGHAVLVSLGAHASWFSSLWLRVTKSDGRSDSSVLKQQRQAQRGQQRPARARWRGAPPAAPPPAGATSSPARRSRNPAQRQDPAHEPGAGGEAGLLADEPQRREHTLAPQARSRARRRR
jgi:hypothetical protein